jgi:1-acyl-sn-glycerol-3-phosphate acyltransferase
MSEPWAHRFLRSPTYRVPATGFGFVLFGAGATLISLTAFPMIYLMPLRKRHKEKLTRFVISTIFMSYVRLLRGLCLLTYEFRNPAQLKEMNQLIVANHPSLLDVVFLIAITGDASCIVKGALWKNPFTAMPVRSANYISNTDTQLFSRCVDLLNAGGSLIVFPEGTRSHPEELLKFHRGLSNIALSSIQKITPVLISCNPPTLMKNQHWYDISNEPPHFIIDVLPVISTDHYMADGQLQSAAARQLNRDLEFYFNRLTGRLVGQIENGVN